MMIAASAAQKKPAEIPQSALPNSKNHVFALMLLVYSPAPYKGYPIAPRANPYFSPMRLLMAPASTQTTEKSPYTKALAAETAYGSAAPPAPNPPRASLRELNVRSQCLSHTQYIHQYLPHTRCRERDSACDDDLERNRAEERLALVDERARGLK